MKKTKRQLKNKFWIEVILAVIFSYICVIIFVSVTFYNPPPKYVVYNIADEYNIDTDLILVESTDDEKIEITDKKIISEILTKLNTVPSVKPNLDKFLFVFKLSSTSLNTSQEQLDSHPNKRTLIFNNSCKITIYGSAIVYDYLQVEYNGKINKPETVEKGFYADIMALVDESVLNLK